MAKQKDSVEAGLRAVFSSRRRSDSILEQLGVGDSILLCDGPADASPILKPSDESVEDRRYQVLGEIARGGVGVIYKSRDRDLARDVALKVLRPEHSDNANVLDRFVEEAQIGGQLQHPGIVPVYGLGLQPDGRPFFAMKLVKGRTLGLLVEESKERRRFVGVFAQVCQTMAYAHSRAVIHRDLKPANVMVGAFGEVQVVDWGFAKVLAQGGVADERKAKQAAIDRTRIATVRSGEGSESIAGSVMGTPAYMPPEQALGHVDELDERSDVFSLGLLWRDQARFDKAYKCLHDALKIQRDSTVLRTIGFVLHAQGEPGQAIIALRDALAVNPQDAGAWGNLGYMRASRGDFEDALPDFERAYELQPEDAIPLLNTGWVAHLLGNYTQAVKSYRQASRIEPKWPRPHHCIGDIHLQHGELEQAIASYRRGLNGWKRPLWQFTLVQPEPELRCSLARTLLRKGELKEALELFRQADEQGSQGAFWYLPADEWADDLEVCLEQVGKKPSTPEEKVACAKLAFYAGRDAEATKLFLEAFAEDEDLVRELDAEHRLYAARAAARLGFGSDDAAARRRALEWLRAELYERAKGLKDRYPETRRWSRHLLLDLFKEPDFEAGRNRTLLRKLPDDERDDWRAFWIEVRRVLAQPVRG